MRSISNRKIDDLETRTHSDTGNLQCKLSRKITKIHTKSLFSSMKSSNHFGFSPTVDHLWSSTWALRNIWDWWISDDFSEFWEARSAATTPKWLGNDVSGRFSSLKKYRKFYQKIFFRTLWYVFTALSKASRASISSENTTFSIGFPIENQCILVIFRNFRKLNFLSGLSAAEICPPVRFSAWNRR